MDKVRRKRIIIVGDLEVGGERGRVVSGGGNATAITATEYKDPQKVLKRWKRRLSYLEQ